MIKYHINPKTGRPNLCNPEKTGVCKYAENGENPPHYDNKADAKAAYEITAKEEFGATTTLSKKSKIERFVQPENIHRFVTSMQFEYDPMNIQPASLSSHLDNSVNSLNFDKPFGGLWFGTQEKTDVEEYGEHAPTNWSMLLGDGDMERDKINPEKGNYYTPEIQEDAKIFQVTDRETYVKLLEEYGFIPLERVDEEASYSISGHKRKVDWEAFAKDYDGVFISQKGIYANHYYGRSEEDQKFREENATLELWDIETLWICNPDVVELKKI